MKSWIKKYRYVITKYKNTKYRTITFLFTDQQLEELGIVYNTDRGGVKMAKSKQPTLRELIIGISTDVKDLKEDVKVLKEDVNAMKNTPTMKAELQGKEYIPGWGKELIGTVKSLKETVESLKETVMSLAGVVKSIEKKL